MKDDSIIEQDKNLLIVTAVEGFSQDQKVDSYSAYNQLKKNNVISLIRNQYEVLHTQPLEETVAFVEDVMARKNK